MRIFSLITLLLPAFSIAQLNYQDLKYLADNTPQKSIEYIKNKGYKLEPSGNKSEILDNTIAFLKLNNRNSINSYIMISYSSNTKNVINYYDYSKNNSTNIENTIKKLGYKNVPNNSTNNCNFYESTNYGIDICDLKVKEYMVKHIIIQSKNLYK